MPRKQNIVWIDVESTGIDPSTESLLQVACRITDHNLEFIDGEGFEGKVLFSEEEVQKLKASTVPFVVNMHDITGLWDALPTGTPLTELQDQLLDHIKQYVPEAKTARIAGNSITLDRNFLAAYMPNVLDHLHYRSYDVSTISGFVEMFVGSGKTYNKRPSTHEAMDDITQSVDEFRYYRDYLIAEGVGITPFSE